MDGRFVASWIGYAAVRHPPDRVLLVLMVPGMDDWETLKRIREMSTVPVHPPDLVLLDPMLPDINGYEVCRRLHGSRSLITDFTASPKGSGCEDHTRRAGEGNAGGYFRLINPIDAIVNVEDCRRATFRIGQTSPGFVPCTSPKGESSIASPRPICHAFFLRRARAGRCCTEHTGGRVSARFRRGLLLRRETL